MGKKIWYEVLIYAFDNGKKHEKVMAKVRSKGLAYHVMDKLKEVYKDCKTDYQFYVR